MTARPPGGFTGQRVGHRTRVVGGEGLPGARVLNSMSRTVPRSYYASNLMP